MVVVEGSKEIIPKTNIWNVSKPILEDWLESLKGPKATINNAHQLEVLKRIYDLQSLWIKLTMLYD